MGDGVCTGGLVRTHGFSLQHSRLSVTWGCSSGLGFLPFPAPLLCFPRTSLAVSPATAPTASRQPGMGVLRPPPLSLAFTGAKDLLCASVIILSSVNGYSSS